VMMVLPVEATAPDAMDYESARRNLCSYYLEKDIPVYLTLERAAKSLANYLGYHERSNAIPLRD